MFAQSRGRAPSQHGATLWSGRQLQTATLASRNDVPTAECLTDESAGTERRRTIRLENYWMSLRQCEQGRFFVDFRPERNPVPWNNCFLAYFRDPKAEPIFEHIGEAIVVLFKPDRTNLPDQQWMMASIASHCGDMAGVLTSAWPVRRDGCLDRPNGILAWYRSLLLPFVNAARSPAYVLGAITYCFRGR